MQHDKNKTNNTDTELLKYGLEYEQTSSGFKMKSFTGGEFFPNKFGALIIIACFIILLYCLFFLFCVQNKYIKYTYISIIIHTKTL